jgi:hypothetical protein
MCFAEIYVRNRITGEQVDHQVTLISASLFEHQLQTLFLNHPEFEILARIVHEIGHSDWIILSQDLGIAYVFPNF